MRCMSDGLLAGVALDLLLGDPHWLPHPVRAIGWWAVHVEGIFVVPGPRMVDAAKAFAEMLSSEKEKP